MAILNDGINGGFRGKVGSVAGYYSNGKWVIRSLPKKNKQRSKASANQEPYRRGFTAVQHFLRPLLPVIRVGFGIAARSKNMSAHNAAKSYLMLNALNEDQQLDYAKVLLTYGDLAGAVHATVNSDDTGLHFTWANNEEDLNAVYNDQVMLAVYHEADGFAHFTLSGARRQAGYELMELPKNKQLKPYHAWISFISDDRKRIAMSTYVGIINH